LLFSFGKHVLIGASLVGRVGLNPPSDQKTRFGKVTGFFGRVFLG